GRTRENVSQPDRRKPSLACRQRIHPAAPRPAARAARAPPAPAKGSGLFRAQALPGDRGDQDAGVGHDEHPVAQHHAVGDETDRRQALADEQPARDARAAFRHLLADLPDQGCQQDRRRGPADEVGIHACGAARGVRGSWPCAWVAAAAAWPTATEIWLRPPTMSPMAYRPGVAVSWWRSTRISPPSVRSTCSPSIGTEVSKPRKL